jgi:enamine deaminase RidA (YjgF/YER057c/UK114 family)
MIALVGERTIDIERFPEGRTGRCGAVRAGGLVYAVATDPGCSAGIAAQTRNSLAELQRTLVKAGSGKSGLLQATVYLSDMAEKPVMERAWLDWIGSEENWPQRACVGADLGDGYLVEIVVTAVVL